MAAELSFIEVDSLLSLLFHIMSVSSNLMSSNRIWSCNRSLSILIPNLNRPIIAWRLVTNLSLYWMLSLPSYISTSTNWTLTTIKNFCRNSQKNFVLASACSLFVIHVLCRWLESQFYWGGEHRNLCQDAYLYQGVHYL